MSSAESQPSEKEQVRPTVEKAKPDAVLMWPTDRIVQNWIVLLTRTEGDQYGLTDEQTAQWERTSVQRWKPFFFEIRLAWLLVRQFCDVHFRPHPPDAELVKRWARQARPVLAVMRTQFAEAQVEFRAMVRSDQMDRYEDNYSEFLGFLGEIHQALGRWDQGDFEQREWWESDPERREQKRQQSAEVFRAIETASVFFPASRPAEGTTRPSEMPESYDALPK